MIKSRGLSGQDIRLKTPSGGVLSSSVSSGALKKNTTAPDAILHWYDGISQGNISNAAAWQEISGIATPKLAANSAYLWTVADSPSNQFAAMGVDGSPQGVLTLTSSTAKVDVEKVTSRTINGVNYIYFMDMGNNGNGVDSRGTGIDLRIFRVVEPTITGSNIATTDFIEIDCAFPAIDGPTLRDMEAAFVADDDKLYMITKRNLDQNVYSLPHALTYTGTQELTYEGDMTALPESRTAPLTTTPCYAVSACINDSGTEILVKNYNNVYVFARNPSTQTVFEALSGALVDVPAYVGGGTLPIITSHPSQEPQGEAMCYSYDQRDFFTCSEYRDTDGGSTSTRFPLFKYTRCTSVPITVSFQDGVSPTAGYAGTLDTTIWDTNPDTTTYGTDASVVADKAVGVESDQRKALIKWDLAAGSIPSNAIVVGARIDLYITAEGQGWTIHQMLVDWNESSTYNTFVGGVTPDDVKAGIPEQCRTGVNLNGVQTIACRNNIYTPSYYLFPMVQGWVSGAYGAYGVIIIATDIAGGDGQQFASREAVTASQRPKLTIRYMLP